MIIYSLDYKSENFGPKVVKIQGRKKLNTEQIIELNNTQIEKTISKIKEYHQKIGKGYFNLSFLDDRKERVCKYCDYRSFCRVSEVLDS